MMEDVPYSEVVLNFLYLLSISCCSYIMLCTRRVSPLTRIHCLLPRTIPEVPTHILHRAAASWTFHFLWG